jgi:hypothetical protein
MVEDGEEETLMRGRQHTAGEQVEKGVDEQQRLRGGPGVVFEARGYEGEGVRHSHLSPREGHSWAFQALIH